MQKRILINSQSASKIQSLDELIDILDSNGNPTGTTALKSVAHANGLFHPTVHIWLYTTEEKILLQKRASTKKVFPNMWDISVAGHVHAGEDIVEAAQREALEEIGLELASLDLVKIGIRKHQVTHPNGIQDNEFHHVFISELKKDINELHIQKEELSNLQLFDLSILKETRKHNNILVPKFQDYYCMVFDKICALGLR